jgi:uncharacterized lipoprotein YddW (UPF0748 family)
MNNKIFIIALVIFVFINTAFTQNKNPRQREMHALWAHPTEAGKTAAEVRAFVAKCKRAHIETIVMDVKGSNGELYFKSKRFPEAIARGYENFDLLEHLVREAHAVGIKVDAWLVDYLEGANGAAFRKHPEWAQLNPDGETTLSEKLGKTRQYPYVWMCPARRPGYTDQWLIPLFEEVVRNYKVDSVHHDYVRYPGDVAPDSYCFCDYCLKEIPRYAMLRYESRADERYRVKSAQPRIEANWWSDPTMLPSDWDTRDRREKADYLLNGSTIPGGGADMRYIFYDYRVHQIEKMVRETAGSVKKINPRMEVSAAVFKNPVLSGRFLGQRWDTWTPWIDVYMPMTYRSHFAGSFEAYLDNLTETTARQMEWIRRQKPLYAGIASTYLYREEFQPFDEIRDRLNEFSALPAGDAKNRAEKARAIKAAYDLGKPRLAQFAPVTEQEIGSLINRITVNDGRDATPALLDELIKKLAAFRADLPKGFAPPEKLRKSIQAARKANPDGIAVFAAGSLNREKLWEVLEEEFKD